MIRKASLAAILLTSTLLPAQSASAMTSLNGRVSQIINALHDGSSFSPRDFSFRIETPNGTRTLFRGLDGVRDFHDFQALNDWLTAGKSHSVFDGGPYKFTHTVLGSYFDQVREEQKPSVSRYGPVLEDEMRPQSIPAAVPEPASWAMMIGGFALIGASMRRRMPVVAFA